MVEFTAELQPMIPRWTVAVVILLLPVLVWLYGWQVIDTVEWRTITAAPFSVTLDIDRQFLYGSPFIFLLGSYYQQQGLDYSTAFLVVHGLGLLFFSVALLRALSALCPGRGWAAGLIVVAGSPLLFVVLTWIGKSDSYLLAFYLLLVITPSRLTTAILAVLMISCHRELALAMLAGHALLRGSLAPIAAGAAIGVAGSFYFTHGLLSSIPASRIDYVLANAGVVTRAVIRHPLVHLAATLGPFWIHLCRPAALSPARLGVLVIAAALACMTFDFTRVFIIAAMPLVLVLTADVVAELRRSGGVSILGRRIGLAALSVLAFLPIQVTAARAMWIRGVEWTLTR